MCGDPPLTLSFIAGIGNMIGFVEGLAHPLDLIHVLCTPSLRVSGVDGKAMQIQLNGTLPMGGDGGCYGVGVGHDGEFPQRRELDLPGMVTGLVQDSS